MEENRRQADAAVPQQNEIDLLELARKIWSGRRLILKWCAVAAVVGLVIGFSIPKEYTTRVLLAPEASDGKNSLGGLGALANMAGFSIGGGNTGSDAVYPDLYPDVVASVPFAVELFDVRVSDHKGEWQTDVYDYLSERIRAPWWSAVRALPGKAVGGILSLFSDDEAEDEQTVNPFRLTREEMGVVEQLRSRIGVSVDKKNSVVTLSVTMQDPLVSATLTDTVMRNLQNYVTEYRTNKARRDLEFTQKLFDEAQRNYYEAQQRYAKYMDANQNIVLRSVRTEQERLQNEMNLTYNLYNQMAQQLQLAKAKVQESTPVYAVVQPASVPLSASKPSKAMILAGVVFLAGIAAVAWILFGESVVGFFKGTKKKEGNAPER